MGYRNTTSKGIGPYQAGRSKHWVKKEPVAPGDVPVMDALAARPQHRTNITE